jgi:glutamine synthetase type III
LSNLRSTSAESTLEKFKANIEVQGKGELMILLHSRPKADISAKDDIISTLTQLNEKLQAKIRGLEKAARADAPKADPKEIKALKEAAERADADLAKRNTECELNCIVIVSPSAGKLTMQTRS